MQGEGRKVHLHKEQVWHTCEKDLWRARNIASRNLQKFHSCLDPVHRPESSEFLSDYYKSLRGVRKT